MCHKGLKLPKCNPSIFIKIPTIDEYVTLLRDICIEFSRIYAWREKGMSFRWSLKQLQT